MVSSGTASAAAGALETTPFSEIGTAAEHAIKAAADEADTRMILGRRLGFRVGILRKILKSNECAIRNNSSQSMQ